MALGCSTDVPISYNSTIVNSDIKGIWMFEDSEQYVIFERPEGQLKLEVYKFNPQSGSFKSSGELDDVFLTSISDGEGSINFLSVGKDETGYDHIEYSFISRDELRVVALSVEYLEKHFKQIDDKIQIGSIENFQSFLKANIRDPSLYDDSFIFFRKKGN